MKLTHILMAAAMAIVGARAANAQFFGKTFSNQTNATSTTTTTTTTPAKVVDSPYADGINWALVHWDYSLEGSGNFKVKSSYGANYYIQRTWREQFGWGMTFGAIANFGMVDRHSAVLQFNLGPAFSFFPDPERRWWVSLPVCLGMSAVDEQNDKGNYDQKLHFGCYTGPQIFARYERVVFSLGLDVNIAKDTSTAIRFGIGWTLK